MAVRLQDILVIHIHFFSTYKIAGHTDGKQRFNNNKKRAKEISPKLEICPTFSAASLSLAVHVIE